MTEEEPDRPGIFASTQNRILFGLSGVLAIVSAVLLGVILMAEKPADLPALAEVPPALSTEPQTGEAAHGKSGAGEKTHEPSARSMSLPDRKAAGEPDGGKQPTSPASSGDNDGKPPPAMPSASTEAPQQAAAAPIPPLPARALPPLERDSVGALAPAPDPGLVEQSSDGLLPKIGVDGRLPWQVYARPFDPNDTRPRIAVVLTSLGLSSAATESVIQGLPGAVTLAFQPYADNLQQWIHLSRAAGHEVLVNLPLEPLDYPTNDPGPQALFTAFEPAENLDRLNWALSRVTGYVGVSTHMGSRFTTSRESMLPIMRTLHERGLLFLDTRSSARSVATLLATETGVPRAINDRFLDAREASRATIDARLAEIERIAKETGVSVAVGQSYPVTIERIRAWVQTLEGKGLVLAPVSAVVNLQTDR